MDPSNAAVPDLHERFDENYVYFYGTTMTDEYNDREADLAARFLELASGMEVLDVPCAYGRIANRLALRGARVTGFDANYGYLERARQDAARLGVEVEYVAGDMRELPWTSRFDGIVNWFLSFGYFDDATNRRMLASWRRALRSGGKLVLDVYNLAEYLRVLPSGSRPRVSILSQIGDDLMMFSTRYNPNEGYVEGERLVIRDGKVGRARYFQRIPAYTELRDWLIQAGFSRVDSFARDGGPLTIDSVGMIVIARV
jgi:SAM-dependent methyltransferase